MVNEKKIVTFVQTSWFYNLTRKDLKGSTESKKRWRGLDTLASRNSTLRGNFIPTHCRKYSLKIGWENLFATYFALPLGSYKTIQALENFSWGDLEAQIKTFSFPSLDIFSWAVEIGRGAFATNVMGHFWTKHIMVNVKKRSHFSKLVVLHSTSNRLEGTTESKKRGQGLDKLVSRKSTRHGESSFCERRNGSFLD